jgi:hypothetical protein
MFKLREFVSSDEIYRDLSSNPNAIQYLEQNPEKINWFKLSSNPNAIHILEKNPDKIEAIIIIYFQWNIIYLILYLKMSAQSL